MLAYAAAYNYFIKLPTTFALQQRFAFCFSPNNTFNENYISVSRSFLQCCLYTKMSFYKQSDETHGTVRVTKLYYLNIWSFFDIFFLLHF